MVKTVDRANTARVRRASALAAISHRGQHTDIAQFHDDSDYMQYFLTRRGNAYALSTLQRETRTVFEKVFDVYEDLLRA
jgi:hypothetical protein